MNLQLCFEYSQIMNQTLHIFPRTVYESFTDKCRLFIAHVVNSVFKMSITCNNTYDQTLLTNDMFALISINVCSKSFHIVHKTVFQHVSVGHIGHESLIAFQYCIPYMVIHWHIKLMHFLLFYTRSSI